MIEIKVAQIPLVLGTLAPLQQWPSPPFRAEREGPSAQRWEGEVGICERSGIPHLTPALSAPWGGEGVALDHLSRFIVLSWPEGARGARTGRSSPAGPRGS